METHENSVNEINKLIEKSFIGQQLKQDIKEEEERQKLRD